jgi:hypothetical protein
MKSETSVTIFGDQQACIGSKVEWNEVGFKNRMRTAQSCESLYLGKKDETNDV